MSQRYDLELFQGAAEYYARYRPKRPQALFDFLVTRFALDQASRELDLGSGTGNASFPLAPCVGEIVAMDPDPDMVRVARAQASARDFGMCVCFRPARMIFLPISVRFASF